MDAYLIATILIFLSAIFGYINVRFLKLPNTIGLMIITIVFTLFVIALSYFDPTLLNFEKEMISKLDFR
jgi:CPA1 family monovalent cation:H+ antiporter